MKNLIIGGLAALAVAGLAPVAQAQAAPGQTCQATWNTMYGVPIGTRTTCFNPDGSYNVCNSLGTAGNGPGTYVDPGVKGTFAAPTNDIVRAIRMTEELLVDTALKDGVSPNVYPSELFTITKAEVVS